MENFDDASTRRSLEAAQMVLCGKNYAEIATQMGFPSAGVAWLYAESGRTLILGGKEERWKRTADALAWMYLAGGNLRRLTGEQIESVMTRLQGELERRADREARAPSASAG